MLEMNEDVKKYLETVKAFAKSIGKEEILQKRLDYLDTYACGDDKEKTRCKLFKDFAPYSFEFEMQARANDGGYRYWFNGGLIYYGPNEDGVSGQYSVRIGDTREVDWTINT